MPSETVLEIMRELSKRGSKTLDFSIKSILEEKMEYSILRDALNLYLDNWRDFTHAGLFSLACEGVGGIADDFVSIQSSIALMSASFDIHDDIIDNSKSKNNKKTVYGKYGLEISLLLGDAFLIKGYSLLFESLDKLIPNKKCEILSMVKKTLFEVGNAHATEISFRGKSDFNLDECISLVEKKAASIELDMYLGAVCGRGTEKQVNLLAKFGRNIGILTTLREEFIDIFEKDEIYQKIKIKRLPIPMLYAMKDIKYKKKIEDIVNKKSLNAKNLEIIVNLTLESKEVKRLKKDMENLVNDCNKILLTLNSNKSIITLREFAICMLEDL